MQLYDAYLNEYPELYLYWNPRIQPDSHLKFGKMCFWAELFYRSAKEKYADSESAFFGPGLVTYKKVDFSKRKIFIEQKIFSLITIEAILQDDYAFFRACPVLRSNPMSEKQFSFLKDWLYELRTHNQLELLKQKIVYQNLAPYYNISQFKSLSLLEINDIVKIKNRNDINVVDLYFGDVSEMQLKKIKSLDNIELLFNFVFGFLEYMTQYASQDGLLALNQYNFNIFYEDIYPCFRGY